jgi:hypothetical protein
VRPVHVRFDKWPALCEEKVKKRRKKREKNSAWALLGE